MTRFVLISDTHNLHDDVYLPDGDAVLCAGDITNKGDLKDVAAFARWLTFFGYKKYITICGNHDFAFENHKKTEARKILEDHGITYLQDSFCEFDGHKIYGSPWQPWFFDWAFNLPRGEALKEVWNKIPDDTSVLITHGPPANILDLAERGNEHTGCVDLLNRIKELKKLKLVLFGHIHEAYGQEEIDGVKYVNASICTLDYKPTNKPVIMDI